MDVGSGDTVTIEHALVHTLHVLYLRVEEGALCQLFLYIQWIVVELR